MNTAAEQWKSDLALWAIPKEILEQAIEKPWIHPPALFEIPEIIKDSLSHRRSREAMARCKDESRVAGHHRRRRWLSHQKAAL